jgi:hypothetical protein
MFISAMFGSIYGCIEDVKGFETRRLSLRVQSASESISMTYEWNVVTKSIADTSVSNAHHRRIQMNW